MMDVKHIKLGTIVATNSDWYTSKFNSFRALAKSSQYYPILVPKGTLFRIIYIDDYNHYITVQHIITGTASKWSSYYLTHNCEVPYMVKLI